MKYSNFIDNKPLYAKGSLVVYTMNNDLYVFIGVVSSVKKKTYTQKEQDQIEVDQSKRKPCCGRKLKTVNRNLNVYEYNIGGVLTLERNIEGEGIEAVNAHIKALNDRIESLNETISEAASKLGYNDRW